MNPLFLSDSRYSLAIDTIKGRKNTLVENAQQILETRGIKNSTQTSLGIFKTVVISPEGTHPINRMAKRIFDLEGTKLVYDPRQLTGDSYASFDGKKNIIYISHAFAQHGQVDSSFFHELRHWSLTRKNRDGTSPYTNSEVGKHARFGKSPITPQSTYNGLFNFEELPVWIYEFKLLTKNYLNQYRNGYDVSFFVKDYQYTIHETLNIAADVKAFAEYFLGKIEQDEARLSVAKDGELARVTVGNKLNYYSFYVPISHFARLKEMNKEELGTYSRAYIQKILEITEGYVEVLEPLQKEADRIGLHHSTKTNAEILEKISRQLSQLH